jgi:hypothetical protein
MPRDRVPSSDRAAGWEEDLRISRSAGDKWLQRSRSALLEVPSEIVPETSTWLLNPLHPQSREISIKRKRQYPTVPPPQVIPCDNVGVIGQEERTMKRMVIWAGAAIALSAATAFAGDITGKWTASFDTQIGTQNYTYDFKADGNKLTGKAKSQFAESEITEGTIKDDDVAFVENLDFQGQPIRIEYKGKLVGDELKLTRKVGDIATEELVAKRAK